MTVPMIVLGALSLVGGYLLIFGGGVQHWLDPVGRAGHRGGRAHRSRRWCSSLITWSWSRSASSAAGSAFGAQAGADDAPVGVSPVTARPRAQPVRRRVQRGGADAPGPVAQPRRWSTSTTAASTAPSTASPPASAAARRGCAASQTGFVRSYALSMLGGPSPSSPCCWR